MKAIVKVDFYDLKEDIMRRSGQEIEVTKERFGQLEGLVEKSRAKNEKPET